MAADFDWRATLREVHRMYPQTELRTISVPTSPGQLLRVRVRQPRKLATQCRTVFCFDAADGQLIEVRDAHSLQLAGRAFNLVYPLHAGWLYKAAMTVADVALTFLGTLAVWSFCGFQVRRVTQSLQSHSRSRRGFERQKQRESNIDRGSAKRCRT